MLPLAGNCRACFPDFPIDKEIEVLLQPGEMLYLPAGWFHNVVSIGDSFRIHDSNQDCKPNSPNLRSDTSVHMAFNYWFHPPDCVYGKSNEPNILHPYSSDYWLKDWKRRLSHNDKLKSNAELRKSLNKLKDELGDKEVEQYLAKFSTAEDVSDDSNDCDDSYDNEDDDFEDCLEYSQDGMISNDQHKSGEKLHSVHDDMPGLCLLFS